MVIKCSSGSCVDTALWFELDYDRRGDAGVGKLSVGGDVLRRIKVVLRRERRRHAATKFQDMTLGG